MPSRFRISGTVLEWPTTSTLPWAAVTLRNQAVRSLDGIASNFEFQRLGRRRRGLPRADELGCEDLLDVGRAQHRRQPRRALVSGGRQRWIGRGRGHRRPPAPRRRARRGARRRRSAGPPPIPRRASSSANAVTKVPTDLMLFSRGDGDDEEHGAGRERVAAGPQLLRRGARQDGQGDQDRRDRNHRAERDGHLRGGHPAVERGPRSRSAAAQVAT